MANIYKYCRFTRHFLYKNAGCSEKNLIRSFRTVVEEPKKSNGLLKPSLIGALIGTAVGAAYAYQQINTNRKNLEMDGAEIKVDVLKAKPPIDTSRKVISPLDSTGLKLTLFQYQSCPFCCKVRTVLDYYGLSYDVVEVSPLFRSEIKWSIYKKVPILLAKVENGYQPLNDSSMIVSVIASYLNDQSHKIDELAQYYPMIALNDEDGKFKQEIVNKYYLMYQNTTPKEKSLNDIVEERKWRKWADDVFVHTISPNIYRTIGEAYTTFEWYSKVGKWDEYFPAWERFLIIHVGAWSMWLIGKHLKKKYHMKNNVRESFYDEINHWLDGIKTHGGTFMGGNTPDLSDLAVYGILRSVEGTDAFNDAFQNTHLATWYKAVKEQVVNHRGASILSG